MPMIHNQMPFCDGMKFEYCFIFKGNSILYNIDKAVTFPHDLFIQKCLQEHTAVDWFFEPEWNIFALELTENTPETQDVSWIPLRQFFAMSDRHLSFLASRGRALLSWRALCRYCPTCGAKLNDDIELTAKRCSSCGRQIFPRITPAVIVLVSRNDSILLVQHLLRIQNIWACVSGFVEAGETAEQTVVREVKEETGILIENVRYVGSQSWPFPDQIMLAYRAEYKSGDIKPREGEIKDARWFNKNSLPDIPQAGSIAHKLITGVFG